MAEQREWPSVALGVALAIGVDIVGLMVGIGFGLYLGEQVAAPLLADGVAWADRRPRSAEPEGSEAPRALEGRVHWRRSDGSVSRAVHRLHLRPCHDRAHSTLRVYDVAVTICSTCYRKLEAKIVFEDGKVLMLKRCPEHGAERVLIADDVEYYRRCREVFIKPPEMPLMYNMLVRNRCP